MFNVGDEVVRVKGEYAGMKVGDISRVSAVHGGFIWVEDFKHDSDSVPWRGGHDSVNFESYTSQLEND